MFKLVLKKFLLWEKTHRCTGRTYKLLEGLPEKLQIEPLHHRAAGSDLNKDMMEVSLTFIKL